MSHRATVLTLRISSLLTVLTLVWAWHFLMAMIATTESRTPTSIAMMSADLSATSMAIGRRDGQHTREVRTRTDSSIPDFNLMQRETTHELLRAHSLPIMSLLIGALIVCLLTPVRNKRMPGSVVDIGVVDRKAA